MNIIGLIAPGDRRIKKNGIIKRNKPDFIYIEKHLACIVVTYDDCNYNKVFKKHKVRYAVIAENTKLKKPVKCKICDGQEFFLKNLMYFVTKSFKINGLNSETSSIAIITDDFNAHIVKLINQASKIFRYIILVTDNTHDAGLISAQMMDDYGVFIDVKRPDTKIRCELAVELNNKTNSYEKNTVIININSNINVPKEYYIALPHKIPFKANNMALSEALILTKKTIDN